jgi:transposase InsO family protein
MALRYAETLSDIGAIASIGTVGASYNRALAESVWASMKTSA